MQFNPPHYEWTASTAREARTALQAAGALIDSHMDTLCPNGGVMDKERTSPAQLRISLDLSGLVQAINDQHAVKAMESVLGELDLPDDI